MELTQEERDLILARRAERGEIEAALAFRQKAIKTAMAWLEWSEEEGLCLTFSTFINQFNYQEPDGKEMFKAVGRILEAGLPSS